MRKIFTKSQAYPLNAVETLFPQRQAVEVKSLTPRLCQSCLLPKDGVITEYERGLDNHSIMMGPPPPIEKVHRSRDIVGISLVLEDANDGIISDVLFHYASELDSAFRAK